MLMTEHKRTLEMRKRFHIWLNTADESTELENYAVGSDIRRGTSQYFSKRSCLTIFYTRFDKRSDNQITRTTFSAATTNNGKFSRLRPRDHTIQNLYMSIRMALRFGFFK
jgi:hypothetical protein